MRRSFLPSTLALLTLGGAALAQQPTRDPVAAEALFQDARAAFKKNDYATACPKFAESYRLDPLAGALFNLADCEEHAGHTASAWQRWQELVTLLRPTPSDERFAVAQQHVADLAKQLPKLRVRWAAGATVVGATIKRDNVELGAASLDTALPIDPGEHVVTVEAPQRKPKSFRVTVQNGQTSDLDISAGEATEATTPPPPGDGTKTPPKPDVTTPIKGDDTTPKPPPPPPSRSAALPALGWVSLGLGVVAAGVAVGTGVGAIGAKSTVDAECGAQKLCSQAGLDAASSGHTMALASTATTVVGAILGGLGITLLTISAATSPSSRAARVVPAVGPTGASLSLEGRF